MGVLSPGKAGVPSLFLYKNETFWFIKLFSVSKDGRDSATLIVMKITHFDWTALYIDGVPSSCFCQNDGICSKRMCYFLFVVREYSLVP